MSPTLKCHCGEYYNLKDGGVCPHCGTDHNKPILPLPAQTTFKDLVTEQRREERWKSRGSPTAEDSKELIKAIQGYTKPSPREHWRKVLATKGLPWISYQFAKDALKIKEAV